MKNLKFTTKLLLVILSVSVVSMISISAVSYSGFMKLSDYSREINSELGFYASDNSETALITQAESFMSRLSKSQAAECNMTLEKIQSEVTSMSGYLTDLYSNPENFMGRKLPLPNEVNKEYPTAKMMVAEGVEITDEIEREMLLVSNAEYMLGNIFEVNPILSNAYLGTSTGINFRYSESNAYDQSYDPRVKEWYYAAFNRDEPVWIDTYEDPYGDICVTNAQSFKDAEGKTVGVVAVDILLSSMIEDILNLRIGETGYAFLFDNKGRYLAHPHYESLFKDAIDNAQGEYKEVLEKMSAGDSDVRSAHIDGTRYYIAYAPLSITNWSLGIVVEYSEIVASAHDMKIDINSKASLAEEQILNMLNNVQFRFMILSCVIIIAVFILSILVSRSFTKPIIKLTNGVINVGAGNLDDKIDIQSKDEIGVLADCFNKMTIDLKNYIENLSKVTAEKERINSDLRVATEIQADMLPKIFPPYADREDLQIAAFMLPARQVGGDFYDFFFLDDEQTKIALIIADVSGKGVPAALFMVIAKILIKNNKELPADEILNLVNNLLYADNNSSMFVTTYYSVLDIATGKYTYVSAGHNPPILYRKLDNDVSYLNLPKTPPLAIFPNKKFVSQEITLQKGDALLLYTDGVTEAFNTRSELYGTERLLENFSKLAEESVEYAVNSLYATVKEFAGEEPQSDDITMLFCRFLGTI